MLQKKLIEKTKEVVQLKKQLKTAPPVQREEMTRIPIEDAAETRPVSSTKSNPEVLVFVNDD